MKLPRTDWQQQEGMARLLGALGADAGETRFVGGCVRDALLDLPVSDVDLATRHDPPEVMRRLRKAGIRPVPTGIAHGTVTALLPSGPVEVTTLRRDVETHGRHATVAFTDDWREDAARRDFTINALSADPASGELHDYFEGLADLEERRVRFIGDPFTRIAEDHLRILRFFRFHARFGAGVPDEAALDACARRANDLMALSRERIADELTKLLALPSPGPTVRLMIENGILRPVLPEIESADRLEALRRGEAEAGIAAHPVRALAALLPREPQLAAEVGARLRLSNKATRRLAAAAGALDERNPRVLAYAIGVDEAVDRLLLAGLVEEAKGLIDWQRPRLSLSGGDLIAMGLEPGPLVARTFQAVEREWGERGFPDDPDVQRDIARAAVDQALSERQ